MSTSKNFDRVAALLVALGLVVTVLFMNGEALGMEKIVDEDAEGNEGTAWFTANDLDGDWDASNPTATITLNGDSATVQGGGAYADGGSVTIANAGWYVLRGSLTDGSVIVNAYRSSKVFLLFDGVTLYRSDDACLRVDQADKVFLTLAAGTENRMESGETYSETALSDNTGGTVFAHDDLTINGSGSLEIVAGYKHGVDANDDLTITGGTIRVTAPSDGFHVNDSFRMCGADVTVAVGDDGVHSDSEVYIESGRLLISECYEGVEAPQITMAGGDVLLYPTDDGINANGGSGGMRGNRGENAGNVPEMPAFDAENGETPPEFNGEGGNPPDMPASDDGSNTQGGGRNGMGGERPEFSGERPEFGGERPGMGGEQAENAGGSESAFSVEDTWIRVTGGNLMIVNTDARDADGLDSNGSVYISGGTIFVSLNGDGGNNAIDYGSESGGVAEISGGTLIAAGSAQMAEGFAATSTQPSIAYYTSAEADSTVTLTDASGKVLLSGVLPASFSYLTLSCPELTVGESYTLSVGGTEEQITLEEMAGTYGTAQNGGFGGMGGFGRGHGGWGGRNGGQTGTQNSGQTGDQYGGQQSQSPESES